MKKGYIPLCLLAAVCLFAFGYYLGCLDEQNDCILCNQTFSGDETYLWDVRTGAIFALSTYTQGERNRSWLDRVNRLPQQTLDTGAGIACFPDFSHKTPIYCSLHAPSSDEGRFMILQYRNRILSYFALQDEIFFNGYFLRLYFDDDCWAISISS